MKPVFSFFIALLLFYQTQAQSVSVDPTIKTSAAVMDNFMDQRFGMFIHWGPVTLRGTEIGWSRGKEVAVEDYDNLYKEFNPVLFNADNWVKAASDAGMKYLTITAKHHDGFCLWPTAVSDYNIMNSPYKKDIVGELANACKKYGIKFCIYFTVLDWHDPDYGIHVPGSKEIGPDVNMTKFVNTMKGELKELVARYHPYMLWFDGNWDSQWKKEYAVDVYTFVKKLSPDVIINNRLGSAGTLGGGDHLRLTAESVGDYATPEQKIGELNMKDPWETCMTIAEQWAWKPNDKMKTLAQCIQTLAKTAGGNGNLLFNVGPMPDGRMEERQIKTLKGMGDWLKMYGESIYGTKGGPFKPNEVYAATRKGNKLYIHVFERKSADLTLPALPGVNIKQASWLKGGKVSYSQDAGGGVKLQLPGQLPDANDSVIVLECDADVEKIPVVAK